MNLIEQIKRDRKAGTDGPWMRQGSLVYALMHAGWNKGVEQLKNRFSCFVQHDYKGSTSEEAEANARRIAHVPDMEHALLAAEHVSSWLESCIKCENFKWDSDQLEYATEALAAFRKTTEAQP